MEKNLNSSFFKLNLAPFFIYEEDFLNSHEAKILFEYLKENTLWESREIKMFGKIYLQPRLIKWYGDKDYTYSKQLFKAENMPKILEELKLKLEKKLESSFNSVLINYYRNENDSMGKHCDDEKELGENPIIASISLGEIREFIIENKKTKEKIKINLKSGSLLIMKDSSQKDYLHSLPKSKQKKGGRINLTFRNILKNKIF